MHKEIRIAAAACALSLCLLPVHGPRASALGSSLGEYEPGGIGSIDFNGLGEISSGLGGYETGEIENIDAEPLGGIEVDLGEYDVPELTGVDGEIEAFYSELVGYLDHDQLTQLAGLTPIEAADLATLQHDLIADLTDAFAAMGIDVAFNPYTGTARVDASLLYAVDKYEVTEAGKAVLRPLMQAYCSVLARDKYRDRISAVTVTGHTDSSGSHEYNQELSERRAKAVYDFCLSGECGVADSAWLAQVLTAEGLSYDELIYGPDGTEDKAASRRVEIGFRIEMGG